MKLSLLLTAALTAIAPLGAADWTQFRGPNGDGLSSETGVPVRMEPSSLTWSIALPGRGLSSPLILGDKVFVTAGSGARQGQRLAGAETGSKPKTQQANRAFTHPSRQPTSRMALA